VRVPTSYELSYVLRPALLGFIGVTRRLCLIVLVAAVAAGAASATSSIAINCGTVSAAGKTWTVAVARITCPAGKGIVRKLAPKHVPATLRYAGKYSGMVCLGGVRSGKRGIYCAGARGELLIAQIAR
jgi:hypothetical protein